MIKSRMSAGAQTPGDRQIQCCIWAASVISMLAATGTWAAPAGSPLADSPVVRSWGTEAGLPQNTVNAMVQTWDGYLWVGTREGLARFDGVRFVVFGLGEGLGGVVVQTLYEDRRGTLWIGTDGGGLSRWTGKRIETVALPHVSMAGESVNALAEDKAGRLWVGTRAGIQILQNGRFETEPDLADLGRTSIYALLPDRHGTMWIATSGQGLYQFADGRLSQCGGPPGDERISAYCLLEDLAGNIWASVGNGKLLCRTQAGWRVYTQEDGVPFAYVTCLAEGPDGAIWAGSLDEGLHVLTGNRFERMESTLPGNAIRSLLFDAEQSLWVGSRATGLSRLSQRKLLSVGAVQGLTNDFTRSVAETADGSLWVGTTGGGLYRGTIERLEPFGDDRIRFYAAVESVLATRDGSLWWGGARGLLRWKEDRLAGMYTNMPWIRAATVTALCEAPDSGLWIGTSLGRLAHFDGQDFSEFPGNVARGPITGLAPAGAEELWVGSMAGGLRRVNARTRQVQSVTNDMLSRVIRTLYLDPEGALWVGTAGTGLARLRDGRVHVFGVLQGLGADTVSQIVEDDFGNLWLGCSRGIIRVSKADLESLAAGKITFLHPRVYGANDGMPAEECSNGFYPAGLKLRSGLLCFSTVRGLVLIDSKPREAVAPPPKVLMEEALVGGRNQELEDLPATDGSGEPPPAGMAGLLRIPAGGRDVELHYTGLSFSSPEKVRFRYQIEGLDRDWVEAGLRRTAYYQRIPPGDYVFRVKACNADGLWAAEEASVAITMQPYFYETNWFLAGSALAVLGSLAGMLRVVEQRRYKRRLARLQTQHAIEKERVRISQDMHDNLGAILTQVSQLSDMGTSDSADSSIARQRFERIGTQARGAVQALDEIIWATNPKNDNLPSFAEYVSRFADELLEGSRMRCWQEVPASLPNVPLRADVRHNLFLAVREAFNNALKHSGASEIWLRIAPRDSEIVMEVEDNGRGFNPSETGSHGNGLGNMRSRLAEEGGRMELRSQPGHGTRIRFVLPMDRVTEK